MAAGKWAFIWHFPFFLLWPSFFSIAAAKYGTKDKNRRHFVFYGIFCIFSVFTHFRVFLNAFLL
jgi:hypothetical protein